MVLFAPSVDRAYFRNIAFLHKVSFQHGENDIPKYVWACSDWCNFESYKIFSIIDKDMDVKIEIGNP